MGTVSVYVHGRNCLDRPVEGKIDRQCWMSRNVQVRNRLVENPVISSDFRLEPVIRVR